LSKSLSPRISGRLLAPIGLLVVLLFLAWAASAHAAFPGANGKIAFDRDGSVQSTEALPGTRFGQRRAPFTHSRGLDQESDQVYSINPDSTGETNLSSNDQLDEDVNWSADGLKIAYDDFADGDQIFSMNGDGSAQTNLTNDTEADAGVPAWSPDRTKIAYSQFDSGNNIGIWVMNADGSDPHEVIPPSDLPDSGYVQNVNPNWSPDGTRLAYSRQQIDIDPETHSLTGDSSQVFVANADGSGTPQNVSNNDTFDEDPNWSPNGTQLAFDRFGADRQAEFIAIWVMNADGSGGHQVTFPTSSNDVGAAWSPDGTQIAYQSNPVSIIKGSTVRDQTIWVVGADGSNDHQVTSPPAGADDYLPDWQPVGSPASSASLASCTAVGSAVIHAADPSGFISALNVHYKVDGGAEQVAPADGSGNATIALSNGAHTVEFWGGDAAGYQEAAHHTGTTTVDTATKCSPAAPRVSVAGVRRACVAKAFNVRVHISSATKPKSVRVFLGSKRIVSTTKTSFTLHINVKKLGRRTRLRIVATDSNGKVTTISRTIARCAVAKPRRKAAPRFTG
jgi:Tol biopolymer transport system component